MILLAIGVLGFTAAQAGIVLAPGDKAPPTRSFDLQGNMVTVNWSENEVTLINFWAAWCLPCRDEMPALQELYERRKDDGLGVIGIHVNGNDDEEELEGFLQGLDITYPVIQGSGKIKNAWGGAGTLPTSYLVKRDGTIVRRYVGATSEQTLGLVDDVEAVLDGRPLKTQVIPGVKP